MFFVWIACFSVAFGLKIADVLNSRSDLTKAASSQITWADKNTLFVVPDSLLKNDLGSNVAGTLHLTSAMDSLSTLPYAIISGDSGVRAVYDNYTPGKTNPEIHIRSALYDSVTTEWITCDDGFLYVLNAPVPSPPSVDDALHSGLIKDTLFASWIQDAQLGPLMDQITDITLLVPTNAAITAAQGQWTPLTVSQKQAVIYNHIWPGITYSTLFTPGTITSALKGSSHALAVTGESSTVDGVTLTVNSDVMVSAGVIHELSGVLFPQTMPGPNDVVTPVNIKVPTSTSSSVPSPTGTHPINADAPRLPLTPLLLLSLLSIVLV